MAHITLDEREHALFEKCMLIQNDEKHPYHIAAVTVTKQVLPLGDVAIQVAGHEWLIERKSLADLLSSIKDGRYEEQSHRLQHAFDPRRVVYVVEGVLTTLKTPKERKLVHATMTSLQVFKGFAVVRTASVQETAEWILAMADKIYRDVTVKHKVPANSVSADAVSASAASEDAKPLPYCSVVKKVKKENVTPQNIGEIFLCQLPGISHVAATAICRAYPSLVVLMDALRLDPQCLQSLTTTDQGGKSRKLGKNVHSVIANYLMFTPSHSDAVTPAPAAAPAPAGAMRKQKKAPVKEARTSGGLGWQGPPLDPPAAASSES
jgi:ERCC4-type nuclease